MVYTVLFLTFALSSVENAITRDKSNRGGKFQRYVSLKSHLSTVSWKPRDKTETVQGALKQGAHQGLLAQKSPNND